MERVNYTTLKSLKEAPQSLFSHNSSRDWGYIAIAILSLFVCLIGLIYI